MSTPHISAEKGDFAKTVLMPGESPARQVHCRHVPERCPAGDRGPWDAGLYGHL